MLLSMLIGAGIGWLIGSAIAAYIEEAINWFRNIWNNHPDFRKNCKAICALVKQGYKAVKRILKIDSSGTSIEEEYYVTGDEGEEISNLDLPYEVEQELNRDGWIVIDKQGF